MQSGTRPRSDEPSKHTSPEEGAPDDRAEPTRKPRSERLRSPRSHRPLPLRTRIILGTLGGLLVVLGIAGLFLPFLQGILFLVLAAAVLSLTSRRIYHWLQGVFGERWPKAWQRVERFRTRMRWKLRRKK